jgi:superfamily II helicase
VLSSFQVGLDRSHAREEVHPVARNLYAARVAGAYEGIDVLVQELPQGAGGKEEAAVVEESAK